MRKTLTAIALLATSLVAQATSPDYGYQDSCPDCGASSVPGFVWVILAFIIVGFASEFFGGKK